MSKRAFVTGGSGFIGRNLIPALVAQGYTVAALARSESAARTVSELGAQPVRGELENEPAMAAGMAGCDVVIHMAAQVGDWGSYQDFYKGNVEGTEHVIAAALTAGVPRLVHVSSEAVLMDGKPIVNADESRPLPAHPMGLYAQTKGSAEMRVRQANGRKLATVIVRPRLVWGKGDTTVLPQLVDASRNGRWMWIGGGHHLTSTCHVSNTVQGIVLAAERGKPGGIYFLTDGAPVEFRTFVTQLLKTQQADPGQQELPLWLARILANAAEFLWNVLKLKGTPFLTKTIVVQIGSEVTVNDARARQELGYKPNVSIEDGLRSMLS